MESDQSLARNASAPELARDEVPWLLDLFERLTDQLEAVIARLDDCWEMRDDW